MIFSDVSEVLGVSGLFFFISCRGYVNLSVIINLLVFDYLIISNEPLVELSGEVCSSVKFSFRRYSLTWRFTVVEISSTLSFGERFCKHLYCIAFLSNN